MTSREGHVPCVVRHRVADVEGRGPWREGAGPCRVVPPPSDVPSLPPNVAAVSLPARKHTLASRVLFPLPRFLMELCTKSPHGAGESGACGVGRGGGPGASGEGARGLFALLPLPTNPEGTPRHIEAPGGDREGRSPTHARVPFGGSGSPPVPGAPCGGGQEARPRVCKLSTSLFCFSSSILGREHQWGREGGGVRLC